MLGACDKNMDFLLIFVGYCVMSLTTLQAEIVFLSPGRFLWCYNGIHHPFTCPTATRSSNSHQRPFGTYRLSTGNTDFWTQRFSSRDPTSNISTSINRSPFECSVVQQPGMQPPGCSRSGAGKTMDCRISSRCCSIGHAMRAGATPSDSLLRPNHMAFSGHCRLPAVINSDGFPIVLRWSMRLPAVTTQTRRVRGDYPMRDGISLHRILSYCGHDFSQLPPPNSTQHVTHPSVSRRC